MYKDMRSIRCDSEDMVFMIIATVQKDSIEVRSPPGVTAMAPKFGRMPGAAYDIEVDDDKGVPWDFLTKRDMCSRKIVSKTIFPH